MGCWFFEKSITVNCITNVFILHQQPMCAAYNDGVCASQLAPTQILLEIDELSYVLKSDIPIQLVAVNKEHIAVSSGRQIVIYEIYKDNSLTTTMVTSFHCDTEKLLIYEHTLIVLTPVDIQLRSMEGTVMQMLLPTLPGEGEPITMDLTGQYLTVASLYGILKIWDLSKREAKLHPRTMAIYEAINDFAEVIEAKCNSNCRLVSITVARTNLMPSSILYVWDIESDQIHEFDFAESNDIDEDDTGLAVKCKGRLVTAHCWDVDNPRLLICRAERLDSRDSKHSTKQMNENDYDVSKVNVVLVSIFATSDHGIVVQDIKPVTDENSRLLGVQAPHIIK